MGNDNSQGVSVEQFEAVCNELEEGSPLSFSMVTRVFGNQFAELLIGSLIDAQDAARAIQGAFARLSLRQGEMEDADEYEQV